MTTRGAVGQMLRGVVLFREIVGVAEGIVEFPKYAEVLMLRDALGVTDGMFVKLFELVTVKTCIVVEFPTGGRLVKPPVGAVVVFETRVKSVKIPELELGIAEVVELMDTGGREDEAAVGRLAVELLEGVGRREEEPRGSVMDLEAVTEVLTFTELGGTTTVAVRTTKVVFCGVELVTLPILLVPGRVEFEPIDEGKL